MVDDKNDGETITFPCASQETEPRRPCELEEQLKTEKLENIRAIYINRNMLLNVSLD